MKDFLMGKVANVSVDVATFLVAVSKRMSSTALKMAELAKKIEEDRLVERGYSREKLNKFAEEFLASKEAK